MSVRLKHTFSLATALFIFWIILSGKFETRYLLEGVISSIVIALVTQNLFLIPLKQKNGVLILAAWELPWFNILIYLPWLFWEIIKANIEVALIILNPKLPIEPQMVKFSKGFQNPVAHVFLANSITLTPGTVTVDVENDCYTVHALSRSAKESMLPDGEHGEIIHRVESVFAEKSRSNTKKLQSEGGE